MALVMIVIRDVPDRFHGFFQLTNDFLFLGVNFVNCRKTVIDINWRRAVFSFFGDTANMSHARKHTKICAKVFLDGFCFCWALYDN